MISNYFLKFVLVSTTGLLLMLAGCSSSFELISDEEYREIASLPDTDEQPRAKPAPGAPAVEIMKPGSDSVKTPFDIDIRFTPADGAAIIPETVKITYVKGVFRKDLTELIREHARMDASGIFGEKAAIPAGKHRFVVEVSDDRGRLGQGQFRVRVTE